MPLSGTLYHLTLVGNHYGNRTQNGFWFTDKSTTLQEDARESLVDLINDFNTWVLPGFVGFCSSSWHGLGLVGQTMNTTPHWMESFGYETTTGSQDADALPADSAAVVALGGGIAGRSHRGRIYVPGIAKTLTESDYLSGGGLALLLAFVTGLRDRFGPLGTSASHAHIIYSPKLGNIRHPGPPPFIEYTMAGATLVQNYNRRTLICSMRRRRPDHGI